MCSPLPLPPEDAVRVPGMLLIHTGDDDDVWNDVLSRMGELPGMRQAAGHEAVADAATQPSLRRRLIVAHDPTWRGATVEDVTAALEQQPGAWVPNLILLTDDRTTNNAQARPLLAYTCYQKDVDSFWITPRQSAMTYLALGHPGASWAIERFVDTAPADLEYDLEEDEEPDEESFYEPMGVEMESLANPPRYTRPAHELPLLDHEWDLLVRTDFTDDAAWGSLLQQVSQPVNGDTSDNFLDQLTCVNDPAFADATPEQVMAQVRPHPDRGDTVADVILIADATTLRGSGHRVLAIPLTDDIGLTFRVGAGQIGTMLPNLGLSNQGIEDWRGSDT
ncbi:hypothetical protein OKJ48_33410 [Streptomyces kunmingensis]|uniref:DUF6924 domain-containing protein n=1 Tax=Streptomyces kunmingensis TaxID=68225 RepID=A0ABU6CMG8_9ACTN|nr:hypothetical protein [Streptomyces kunmingensis]MEB3965090.1 hypothetical protein [Streptomyces kunmingensis]